MQYRTCKYLDKETKMTIYNTIVKQHFQFCSTLLLSCNKTEINNLQVKQNKAMRLILKKTIRNAQGRHVRRIKMDDNTAINNIRRANNDL